MFKKRISTHKEVCRPMYKKNVPRNLVNIDTHSDATHYIF